MRFPRNNYWVTCPVTVWHTVWLEGQGADATTSGFRQYSCSVSWLALEGSRRVCCIGHCLEVTPLCGRGGQNRQGGYRAGFWDGHMLGNWSLPLDGFRAHSLLNPCKVKYALNWTAKISDDHKSDTSYFLSFSRSPAPPKLRPLVHPVWEWGLESIIWAFVF